MGIMEKKMETTTLYRVIWGIYRQYIGVIWGQWKRKWRQLHYIGVYRGYRSYMGVMERKCKLLYWGLGF